MDQVNTVRSYFIYNYGNSLLRADILTFLTLGDLELSDVQVSISKDGPKFSCSAANEWICDRPMMNKPPGMRTQIDEPLKSRAITVYEKYNSYGTKTLIYLTRTKTYYKYRDIDGPLDYQLQLQWFQEMRYNNFVPDAYTLSDNITDAEYIGWESACMTHSQARARYLDCLRHETKIAIQLEKK